MNANLKPNDLPVNLIGSRDSTTRRILESILAQEEEHAEDLVDLLEVLPKD